MVRSDFSERLSKALAALHEKNPGFSRPLEEILQQIEQQHHKDPALRVLIPDFHAYVQVCSRPIDSVYHESIVILGVRNNDLDSLLDVIRRYVLYPDGQPRARQQYISDLNELHWWGQKTETDRYRVGNIFFGRIFELMLIRWLEHHGHKIINLEAWDEKSPDIVVEKDGVRYNIQAKFIPQYKAEFEQDCLSSMAPRWGTVDCHSATENLSRHIDDAARQLDKYTDGLKVAAVIISNQSFHSYSLDIETCCRTIDDVLELHKDLYARKDIDQLWVFSNQGIAIRPKYVFDIRNRKFMKFNSKLEQWEQI